jgi:hypothetical protein
MRRTLARERFPPNGGRIAGMDYRVPMRELTVRLALAANAPAEYVIFLSPSSRASGMENVSEYLAGDRRFLPMVGGGSPRIVNRDQILWLEVEGYQEEDEVSETTIIQKLVILEMSDGTRIEGSIDVNRPPDRSRLSDVLNDRSETFLRLSFDRTSIFVNKNFVRLALPR